MAAFRFFQQPIHNKHKKFAALRLIKNCGDKLFISCMRSFELRVVSLPSYMNNSIFMAGVFMWLDSDDVYEYSNYLNCRRIALSVFVAHSRRDGGLRDVSIIITKLFCSHAWLDGRFAKQGIEGIEFNSRRKDLFCLKMKSWGLPSYLLSTGVEKFNGRGFCFSV